MLVTTFIHLYFSLISCAHLTKSLVPYHFLHLYCRAVQEHHTVCNCQLLFVPVKHSYCNRLISSLSQINYMQSYTFVKTHCKCTSCLCFIYKLPLWTPFWLDHCCALLSHNCSVEQTYFFQSKLNGKISIDCWRLKESCISKKVSRYLLSRFYGASFVGQLHWQHCFELCRLLSFYAYLLICSCTLCVRV